MWWVIPFVTSLILSFAPYALADKQARLMLDTGGHMAAINDIAFTPDGKQLVSASDDKTIRVWSLQTGKTERVLYGEMEAGESGKIASMAISPDGKWLAAGVRSNPEKTDNFAIRLYDFASGAIVTLLKGHKQPVVALAFSPNSKYLISGSEDNRAMLWDIAKQSRIDPPLLGHDAPIRAVAFAPDNKQFVTGDDDGIVIRWKVKGNRYHKKLTARGSSGVKSLDVANGVIGVGHDDGDINLWELATNTHKKKEKKNAAVRGVKFDGDVLWAWVEQTPSCGASGTSCPYLLEAVNVDSDAPGDIKTLDNQSVHNTVYAASIKPQYELAAAASEDHKIRVWNLKTGAPRTRQDGEPLILGGVGQQPSVVAMLDDGRIGWGNNLTDVESGAAHQFPRCVLALPSQQNQRVSPIKLDNKDAKKLACPEGSAQEPDQPGMVRCGQKSYGNLSLQFRDGYEQAPIIDIMEGQNTREEGTVKTGLMAQAHQYRT
jgi:WD40 repeat protein